MTDIGDIVLDEWERARRQIRSGLRTLYVLGMEKGGVIDDVIDMWDEETGIPREEMTTNAG